MRMLIFAVFGSLAIMSVVAVTSVRPERGSAANVVDAYFAIGDEPGRDDLRALMDGFRDAAASLGVEPFESYADIASLPEGAVIDAYRAAFREYVLDATGRDLAGTVTLTWSTDANPARSVQMALFRTWHLRTFGEPVDIETDPSNRELTKAIVQSVAGAGPDIIEHIGPPEMISLVRAGIALDITDYAEEHGFGVETVFDAARSSIAVPNDRGELRQYAYPCNVGYTVLMYHRDLLANAGVAVPTGGWTIDEMLRAGERVLAVEHDLARPLFAVMNLDPFNTALGAGGRLFNGEAATHCVFNSPATVAGLRAYRDLIYEHGAMPRPAEAASMSASTAGGFGSDVSGSAPGLFAQKSIAMYVGGRWEYVIFAIANRDRVVVPAIDRRLDRLASDAHEAELLRAARASLVRDVLVPIGDDAHAAVEACLTEEDRARLLHIGIAHIPTVTGEPYYAASARGAAVNRALARDDPDRLVYAMRFLRFLGSEQYNEQINGTYDSICGSIAFCTDEDGISGPPAPLPGLTGFDSPVYTEAMLRYAEPWEVSPYVGRTRLMTLMGEVLQDLQGGAISAQEAAARIEESINRQIIANVRADAGLRERWSAATGIDPGAIDTRGSTPIRAQIEARTVVSADRAAAGGQR